MATRTLPRISITDTELIRYLIAAAGMMVIMYLAYQWNPLWGFLIVGGSLIAHELGHKIAGRLAGIPHDHFQLAPLLIGVSIITAAIGLPIAAMGGVTTSDNAPPQERFLMVLGGPLTNALLFTSLYALHAIAPFTIVLLGQSVPVFLLAAFVNLDLAAFNWLPIPGFDGWHAAHTDLPGYLGFAAILSVLVLLVGGRMLGLLGGLTIPHPVLLGLTVFTTRQHGRLLAGRTRRYLPGH